MVILPKWAREEKVGIGVREPLQGAELWSDPGLEGSRGCAKPWPKQGGQLGSSCATASRRWPWTGPRWSSCTWWKVVGFWIYFKNRDGLGAECERKGEARMALGLETLEGGSSAETGRLGASLGAWCLWVITGTVGTKLDRISKRLDEKEEGQALGSLLAWLWGFLRSWEVQPCEDYMGGKVLWNIPFHFDHGVVYNTEVVNFNVITFTNLFITWIWRGGIVMFSTKFQPSSVTFMPRYLIDACGVFSRIMLWVVGL